MSRTSSVEHLLDQALDRAVVPGYTRVGYRLRRRWWAADPAPGSLAGRHVAVTGASSGLGQATALAVARLGATVHLLVRDEARGRATVDELLAALPRPAGGFVVERCDVSDLDDVRRCAADLAARVPRLHALVHNAGVLPPARSETADGHELTVATHVLGPHLLTGLLAGALAADGDGRVVFVSSGGMYTQRLHLDDLEYRRGEWSGKTAYARTKRMQVLLAERWAVELAPRSVSVHSMHPGWADTPGVRSSLPGFHRLTGPVLRTPEEGADTVVWLVAAPDAGERTGLFWHDRLPRPTSYLPTTRTTPADVERLWDFCVEATGVPATEHV